MMPGVFQPVLGSIVPSFTNFLFSNSSTLKFLKKILGIAPQRSIPLLYKITLKSWLKNNLNNHSDNEKKSKGKIYFFVDEFTNYNDVVTGIKAIKLLQKLGYEIQIPIHKISGRALISKGLLRKAKNIAVENISLLKDIISEQTPLIGIEPSAILTFRDEYPDLVDDELRNTTIKLGKSALMFDEFISQEIDNGNISKESFTSVKKKIKLHGHCHQKSIASTEPTKKMLSLPENYDIEEIPSGCCGMAGSFGYEKGHYDISMKIGELKLFPEVKKTDEDTIIAAPGTSCRHQIKDGTRRTALHPVEILYNALK